MTSTPLPENTARLDEGHTIRRQFQSSLSAVELFELFTRSGSDAPRKPVALLETVEQPMDDGADSQNSVQMLSAALRLECRGARITINALNANGRQALPRLHSALATDYEITAENDVLLLQLSRSNEAMGKAMSKAMSEQQRLTQPTCLTLLERLLACLANGEIARDELMVFTLFAFDLLEHFERLPQVANGPDDVPDMVAYLADEVLLFNDRAGRGQLIAHALPGDQGQAIANDARQNMQSRMQTLSQFRQAQDGSVLVKQPTATTHATPTPGFEESSQSGFSNVSDGEFEQQVVQAKQHLQQGDAFQLVLSRRFSLPCTNAFTAYCELRNTNPSPYQFYLRSTDFELFGASPECALKVESRSRRVHLHPIAGTRPRALQSSGEVDHEGDARLELALRQDTKEQAEHVMLVDLARNDLARIAVPGSRRIEQLMTVKKYSRVMHLVSHITARLREELTPMMAYRACLNMGTLTGAPKVRASQLIRQFEGERRGAYGGAIGYLTATGDFNSAIVIRSALVREGQAYVRAGAGIVLDSVPAAEAQETRSKARAVVAAIQLANAKGGKAAAVGDSTKTSAVNLKQPIEEVAL